MGRLPTFYVVGAMKSGTTSLYRDITGHPDVFMSTPKELHFYVADRNWSQGVDWYAEQFAGANGAKAIGEASVTYTQMPFRDGVPERMAALTPDARIIYIVRHPVERMLSHYRHNLGNGRESRPPEAAFNRRSNYQAISRYAMQLRHYLDHFSREQFLVVPAERYFSAQEEVVRAVWRHIGVDPDAAPVVQGRINATGDRSAPPGAVRTLRGLKGMDGALRLLPKPLRGRLKSALPQRPLKTQRISISPSERARLEDGFRADVAELRPFVQGDFDGWGLA
jgi:hypothetical protein